MKIIPFSAPDLISTSDTRGYQGIITIITITITTASGEESK